MKQELTFIEAITKCLSEDDVHALVLILIGKTNPNRKFDTGKPASSIIALFAWGSTPQGHVYWNKMHNKLQTQVEHFNIIIQKEPISKIMHDAYIYYLNYMD